MKDKNKYFSHFNTEKSELIQYYLDPTNKKHLWQLTKKGILFELFQNQDSHVEKFFRVVSETIKKRREKISPNSDSIFMTGKYLIFDPQISMYDGLAEMTSEGFFDSDDVPPPEFWLGIEEEKLISFVPSELLNVASLGVEECLSGSLEWA